MTALESSPATVCILYGCAGVYFSVDRRERVAVDHELADAGVLEEPRATRASSGPGSAVLGSTMGAEEGLERGHPRVSSPPVGGSRRRRGPGGSARERREVEGDERSRQHLVARPDVDRSARRRPPRAPVTSCRERAPRVEGLGARRQRERHVGVRRELRWPGGPSRPVGSRSASVVGLMARPLRRRRRARPAAATPTPRCSGCPTVSAPSAPTGATTTWVTKCASDSSSALRRSTSSGIHAVVAESRRSGTASSRCPVDGSTGSCVERERC